MRSFFVSLLVGWLCAATAFAQDHGAAPVSAPISVSGAYAYPPLGAGKVSVSFMSLHNQSAEAYQLVGVHSDAFERVELHTHLHEDGVMKMRQVDAIDLPAGENVTLQSGGLHLMLFAPKRTLVAGDSLKLTLLLKPVGAQAGAAGLEIPLVVPVKARTYQVIDSKMDSSAHSNHSH